MIGYQNVQENGTAFDEIGNYTIEQCEEYLQNYPNGLSAEKIRERLKSICIVRNWTYEQCGAYLQSFPNGTCANAVRNRMKQLSPNNTNNAKTSYERKDDYSNKASNTTNSYGEPTGIIVLKVLATIVLVAFMIGMLVEMIRGDIKVQWHTLAICYVFPIGLIGKIWSGDLF